MKKPTYSDKLKDPRWQKKRLEVFNRDEFKCKYCKDGKSTLHVHHKEYVGEPWEADIDLLETVCDTCHLLIEWLKKSSFTVTHIQLFSDEANDNPGKVFLIRIKEDDSLLIGKINKRNITGNYRFCIDDIVDFIKS